MFVLKKRRMIGWVSCVDVIGGTSGIGTNGTIGGPNALLSSKIENNGSLYCMIGVLPYAWKSANVANGNAAVPPTPVCQCVQASENNI